MHRRLEYILRSTSDRVDNSSLDLLDLVQSPFPRVPVTFSRTLGLHSFGLQNTETMVQANHDSTLLHFEFKTRRLRGFD